MGRAGLPVVGEDIARMIQDYIEYDVEAGRMGSVHQRSQLTIGIVGISGEFRLCPQKIVYSVTVVAASVKPQILQDRAQPDGTGTE